MEAVEEEGGGKISIASKGHRHARKKVTGEFVRRDADGISSMEHGHAGTPGQP